MNICITPDSIKLVGAYINRKLPEIVTSDKSAKQILNEIFESALADLKFSEDAVRLKELVLQHLSIAPQLILKHIGETPSLADIKSYNEFKNLSKDIYNASQDKSGVKFQSIINRFGDIIGNEIVTATTPSVIRYNAISLDFSKTNNQEAQFEPNFGYSRNITDPSKIFQADVARQVILSNNLANLKFKLVTYKSIKGNTSLDPGTTQDLVDASLVLVLVNTKGEYIKFDQDGKLSVEGMIPLYSIRTKREQYKVAFENKTKVLQRENKISPKEAYDIANEELTRHLDFINSLVEAIEKNEEVLLDVNLQKSSLGFIELDINNPTDLSKIENFDKCDIIIRTESTGYYATIKPQFLEEPYRLFGKNLTELEENDIEILFQLLKNSDIKLKSLDTGKVWAAATIKSKNLRRNLIANYLPLSISGLFQLTDTTVQFRNNAPINNEDLTKEDLINFINSLSSKEYNYSLPLNADMVKSLEEATKPNQFYYKNGQLFITTGVERNFALPRIGTSITTPTLLYAVKFENGEFIVSKKSVLDHIKNVGYTTLKPNGNLQLKGNAPYLGFNMSITQQALSGLEDIIDIVDFRSLSELNQDTITEKQEKEAVEWFEDENNPLKKIFQLNYIDQIHERGPSFVAEFLGSAINLYLGSKKTDIYHESFHAFSKGILSTKERNDMYNAIRKAPGKFEVIVYGKKKIIAFADATDIEVEEYLAEQFRAYAMNRTGYKNSISVRIKQFFDKVWNVLKAIFGNMTYNDAVALNKVNGVVNTIFNNLYEGNIDISKFVPASTQETLYRSTEINTADSTKDEFSLEDINLLMGSFQSLIAEFTELGINAQINPDNKRPAVSLLIALSKMDESHPDYKKLMTRYIDLTKSKDYNDGYGKFEVERNPDLLKLALTYIKNNLETRLGAFKKQNKSDLNDYIVTLLEKALNNFGDINNVETVIDSKIHKNLISLFINNYSNFKLKSTDFQEELAEEDDFSRFYKSAVDVSLRETIDERTLQILSNIQQYTFQGKGDPIVNILGIVKLKPVGQMITKVARLLSNTIDADDMHAKLQLAAKGDTGDKEILQLLRQLGNVSELKTFIGQNQWSAFNQSFNKFDLKLREFIIEKTIKTDKNEILPAEVTITSRSGQSKPLYKEVEYKWKDNFSWIIEGKTEYLKNEKSYVETDGNGKKYLDINKILADWPLNKVLQKTALKNQIDFLKIFGIELSDIDEVKSELSKATLVKFIWENLNNRSKIKGITNEEIQKNYARLYKFSDIVKSFTYINDVGEPITQPDLNGYISLLAQLEYNNSDVFSSFMEYNAQGDKQSTKVLNSTLTVKVNKINSSKNYFELIRTPGFEWLDYTKNPFVASCKYFVDMFNLQDPNKNKRGVRNNSIKITVENLSGSKVIETTDGISEDKGIAAFSSDKKTKFTSDFHLTLENKQEMVRTEAKSTSLSIHSAQTKKHKTNDLRKSGELVINNDEVKAIYSEKYDEDLNKTYLYDEFYLHLEAELLRINRINAIKDDIKSIAENNKKGIKEDLVQFDYAYLERGSKFYLFENIITSKELLDKLLKLDITESFSLDERLSKMGADGKQIKKEIDIELKNYFEQSATNLYNTENESLIIADNVFNNYAEEGVEEEAIRLKLFRTFVINNFIQNANTVALFFGDPAVYNIPVEDFHKRNAGLTSTGKIFRHDDSFLKFINSDIFNNKAFSKQHNTKLDKKVDYNYTGFLNTAILKEKKTKSEYLEYYRDIYGLDITEYQEMKEADGQGYISFDAYRLLNISSNEWSDGQEALYQKMLANEAVTKEDLKTTFPIRKFQFFGDVTNDTQDYGLTLKAFHKFSLLPLIPELIEGTPLQDMHERMMEQGIDYATFQSGSKLSVISKIDYNIETEKFEPVFDEFYDNKRDVDNNLQFVVNKIHVNSLKNQVFLGEGYHGDITLPTQVRKIALLGLNDAGIPIDYLEKGGSADKWEKLSESEKQNQSANYVWSKKYSDVLNKIQNQLREELLDDLGLTYNESTSEYEGDTSKLLQYLKEELASKELLPTEIDFIEEDGKLRDDLSLSLQSEALEKLLITLVDKKLRRMTINGEALVQVAGTMFEKFKKPSESDLVNYGSNELKTYYEVDENGNLVKDLKGKRIVKEMEIKISLQGDFKKLLYATHPDEKIIAVYKNGVLDYKASLARLNEALKNNDFKTANKRILTIAGVRIPTQGPNALDAAVIVEFLPEWASNMVILPAEVVAKSGADYDVDKIYWMFPNIVIINNTPQLQKHLTNKVNLTEINNSLESNNESIESVQTTIDDLYREKEEIYNSTKILSATQREKNKEKNELLKELIAKRKALSKESKAIYNKTDKYENLKRRDQAILHKKINTELKAITDEINNIDKSLSDDYSSSLAELIGVDDVTKAFEIINEKIKIQKDNLKELREVEAKLLTQKYGASIAGLENEFLSLIIEKVTNPTSFKELITANTTDEVRPVADLLEKKIKKPYNKFYRRTGQENGKISNTTIYEYAYNASKQQENLVGKDSLGIAAIAATYYAIFNSLGLKLTAPTQLEFDQYTKALEILQSPGVKNEKKIQELKKITSTYLQKNKNLKLNHNNINGAISVSNNKNVSGKVISDLISQLVNGYVDVAKAAWIFNAQGTKENTPTLLFMVMAGVDIKSAILFSANPLIIEYNELKKEFNGVYANLSRDPEIKVIDTENFANKRAKDKILQKYKDLQLSGPKENIRKFNEGEKQFDPKDPSTWGDNELYKLATTEPTQRHFEALIHYFDIEDIANDINKFESLTKFDTQKIESISDVEKRLTDTEAFRGKKGSAIPAVWWDLIEKSPVGLLNNDVLILALFQNKFKIRNNKALVKKSLELTAVPGVLDKVLRTDFKNDFLWFLYQNSVYSNKNYNGYNLVENSDPSFTINIDDKTNTIIYGKNYLLSQLNVNEYKDIIKFFDPNKSSSLLEFVKFIYEYNKVKKENINLSDEELFDKYYYLNRPGEKSYGRNYILQRFALYNSLNPTAMFDSVAGVANIFRKIKEKYPNLERYSLITDMRIINDDKLEKKNLSLPNIKDIQQASIYKEDMLYLRGDVNPEVSHFFNLLDHISIMQTGMNRRSELDITRLASPYSFYNAIVNGESYVNIIDALNELDLDYKAISKLTKDKKLKALQDVNGQIVFQFFDLFKKMTETTNYRKRVKGYNYTVDKLDFSKEKKLANTIFTSNNITVVNNFQNLPTTALAVTEENLFFEDESLEDVIAVLADKNVYILNKKLTVPEDFQNTYSQKDLDDLLLKHLGIDNKSILPKLVTKSKNAGSTSLSIANAERKPIVSVKDEAMANASTVAIATYIKPINPAYKSSTKNYIDYINKNYPSKIASTTTEFTNKDSVWVFGAGIFPNAYVGSNKEEFKSKVQAEFEKSYVPLIQKAIDANVVSFNVGTASGIDAYTRDYLKNSGYFEVKRYTSIGTYYEYTKDLNNIKVDLFTPRITPVKLKNLGLENLLNEIFPNETDPQWITEFKEADYKNAKEKIKGLLTQAISKLDLQFNTQTDNGQSIGFRAFMNNALINSKGARIDVGFTPYASYIEELLMDYRTKLIQNQQKLAVVATPLIPKDNKPTQPSTNGEVIPLNESQRFTRESVEKDTDYMYLFTDNAGRTSGSGVIDLNSWYAKKYGTDKKYASKTQAVARGLENVYPITTMVDDKRTQWTDAQFDTYKKIIDDEIETIKQASKKYKGIKFGAEMPFGKGAISNMKDSAPKIWNYLNTKLAEIGIDNTGDIPTVIITQPQVLDANTLETTSSGFVTGPVMKGFKKRTDITGAEIYDGNVFNKNEADAIFNKLEVEFPKELATPDQFDANFKGDKSVKSIYFGPIDYYYNGLPQAKKAKSMPEWLNRTVRELEKRMGVIPGYFDTALINKYVRLEDKLGLHTDSEPNLLGKEKINPTVLTLSLGAERKFLLAGIKNYKGNDAAITTKAGNVLVMGKNSQINYLHGIEPGTGEQGTRYSITLRHTPDVNNAYKDYVASQTITDFNSLTEFNAEQKKTILTNFVTKAQLISPTYSEEQAIKDINEGLQYNRESTIIQLKKCY